MSAAATKDTIQAVACAERYLNRCVADVAQRRAMHAAIAAQQPADMATAMRLVHAALARQAQSTSTADGAGAADATDVDDAADAARVSLRARLQARFMPPGEGNAEEDYRGASMPAIKRLSMAPPSVRRNPLQLLGRLFGRHTSQRRRAPRRHRPLRPVLRLRQCLLALLVFVPAIGATAYMATVLPHGGTTPLELVILAAALLLFAWILVGFWTALCGFGVLCHGGRYRISSANTANAANAVGTAAITDTTDTGQTGDAVDAGTSSARTAVVMPIYEEDVARAFAGMQAAYEAIDELGRLGEFDFFVLSDSVKPDTIVAEQQAWAQTCQTLAAFGRVFYRRRRARVKRKSGNVADFCRRWGSAYDYMIVFDADSIMAGSTMTELVDRMHANADAALIQTPPLAVNRDSFLARVQQFATRVYGRMFAAGLHFWHLDNGHYWGHNAIIRIQPFMAHCALPRLPGRGALSGDILSHDFVEAALLSRAGWGVYIAYDLGGSYEEVPPTLLEELGRDRRWCRGNIQHFRLLFSDHLAAAHRALFANGIMAYTSAAIWFMFLLLSSTEAVLEAVRVPDYFPEPGSLFPHWPVWEPIWAVSLFVATIVVLFLPKVLGMAMIIRSGRQSQYGGTGRLVLSTLIEIVLTTFLAPIRMLTHTWFVVSTIIGHDVKWGGQQRSDQRVPWARALRFHLPGMVLALVWGGILLRYTPGFFPWLAPVLVPLLIAPCITVFSSRTDVGLWLRRHRLQLIPEETQAPAVLRRVSEITAAAPAAPGFAQAVVDPHTNALHVGLQGRPRSLTAELQRQRSELAELALTDGPEALNDKQKCQLLADSRQMLWLHYRVWSDQPAAWSRWLLAPKSAAAVAVAEQEANLGNVPAPVSLH